jgi:nicotinamidase-related amidase
MTKQQKHHYIPSFYTKRWATPPDNKLIEYRLGYPPDLEQAGRPSLPWPKFCCGK